MRRVVAITFTIYLLFAAWVSAETGVQNIKQGGSGPVNIASNEMVSENNGEKVIFIGDVVTKRDNITIYSDKLEVYNSANKKDGKQNSSDNKNSGVSMIIAIGNVRIENAGKHAKGDKAVYLSDKKEIELIGNVSAWEDNNIVTGDNMIFFIDDDKLIVKRGKEKRVEVTFFPKDTGQKKEKGKDDAR